MTQAPFRPLDDQFAASPQIGIGDVTTAANQGFVTIVNNRPDGEDPSAPQGAAIAAACAEAGLRYAAIPVTHAGFGRAQVDAMAAVLQTGPVLAYCRSGTRSTLLWALARAALGDDDASIAARAAAAGYDVAPVAGMFAMVRPG